MIDIVGYLITLSIIKERLSITEVGFAISQDEDSILECTHRSSHTSWLKEEYTIVLRGHGIVKAKE